MNEIVPVDRFWVNVAIRIQLLQLNTSIDMKLAYEDAIIMQNIACGPPDQLPDFCQVCGESTDNVRYSVIDYLDVGIDYNVGPVTEAAYNCNLCGSEVAYWAYGYFNPRY